VNGRVTGIAVSSTSVVIAAKNPNRTRLILSVGESTGAGSVILKDQQPATTTNGFPLAMAGGNITLEGRIAGHEWSAIRLAALDVVVGVIEGFDDNLSAEGETEKNPVPVDLVRS
jgi:hypothetical protein